MSAQYTALWVISFTQQCELPSLVDSAELDDFITAVTTWGDTGMQAVKGMFGRGGMGGGAAGAMMGKTPLPVYVVNFGSSGGMGLNMPGPGGKGTGGAAGKLPRGRFGGGRMVGAGMAALRIGLAGMDMVGTVIDGTKTYNESRTAIMEKDVSPPQHQKHWLLLIK